MRLAWLGAIMLASSGAALAETVEVNRTAPVARLRIRRGNEGTQLDPRHYALHLAQFAPAVGEGHLAQRIDGELERRPDHLSQRLRRAAPPATIVRRLSRSTNPELSRPAAPAHRPRGPRCARANAGPD